MVLAAVLDFVPYVFALLTGLLGGILVGVWLVVSGRVKFETVADKILKPGDP